MFDIDISVCMSCQICVEVCPFESIKMDTEFELSNGDRFEALLVNKDQLAKSNEHYRKIHPTDAAESDAVLAAEKAKAEAKAKADAEAKAKACGRQAGGGRHRRRLRQPPNELWPTTPSAAFSSGIPKQAGYVLRPAAGGLLGGGTSRRGCVDPNDFLGSAVD